MRKLTLSTTMDTKGKEQPICTLFSTPEGDDPFQKMIMQKALRKGKRSYIKIYKAEMKKFIAEDILKEGAIDKCRELWKKYKY